MSSTFQFRSQLTISTKKCTPFVTFDIINILKVPKEYARNLLY